MFLIVGIIRNMKKTLSLLCLLFVCVLAGAQTKYVSVLGDSYSTFEGAIPKGNAIWYFKRNNPNQTDVNRVEQTWWSLLIADKGWKLEMNESDIIFIFGATNDSWAHSPIGEYKYDDITTDDLWSFRPAMAKMLAWMKEHYAQSDIYFLLNDGLSADINTSVKTICEHYGVKCIELQQIDKMAGHPSVKGMQQIAKQVAEAM